MIEAKRPNVKIQSCIALLLLFLAAATAPCLAAGSRLTEFIGKVPAAELVPGADHYGPVQGSPPVAKVFAGERLAGYAFVNADWVNSTGYSGEPIQILVGLTTDGKIAGARLMAHHEPIVLIGIPIERITAFIHGYVGRDVLKLSHGAPSERPAVDIVSGATVTVTVIAESMVRSAIRVARAEGLAGAAPAKVTAVRGIDPSHRAPSDWIGLLGDGSVRHLSLSVGEVTEAFKRAGDLDAADHPETPDPSAPFIDLYVAPVSVPAIGKRLLGDAGFAALAAESQARAASDPDSGQWGLFVQGLRLCTRRSLRSLRDIAGRQQHPFSRHYAHAAERYLRGRRADVPGCRPVSRARGTAVWTLLNRGGCSCWRSVRSARAARHF